MADYLQQVVYNFFLRDTNLSYRQRKTLLELEEI